MEEEINEFIELKRLVKKLEEELSLKNTENLILEKENNNIKILSEELQNECNELNKKLSIKNSEIKKLEKKYKEEKDNIINNFEKQKEVYESKLLKLSSINPVNNEISLEREIQIRYNEKLKQKNIEIEILKNQIKKLENDKNELKNEIENEKRKQIQILNLNEEKDIINDFVIQEDDEKKANDMGYYTQLKKLQSIIKDKDENIDKLYQELDQIKSDRKKYELDIEKKYFLDLNKFKDLESINYKLKQEIISKNDELKEIENKLLELQEFLDESKKEKDMMIEEKTTLLLKINNLENELMNNEEIQKDLENLRELVQKYESEQILNQKIKKQTDEKNKNKINELQRKLEESKEKLSNFAESNNLKNNINNINYIENNNFENNNDINIYKIEYEKIHQKYNLLLIEQKMKVTDLKQKEEENEILNQNLREVIKKEKQRKEKYYQLKEKYKILLEKKERYKDMSKIAKRKIENIVNLLTPEQKKNIENEGNKYLIDLDSFSFTEIM